MPKTAGYGKTSRRATKPVRRVTKSRGAPSTKNIRKGPAKKPSGAKRIAPMGGMGNTAALRAKNQNRQMNARPASRPARPASTELKYGEIRSAGQGIGGALESFGDIGEFLKGLGKR